MKKAAVIMGSDSDFPVVSKAVIKLKEFGIPYEVHVMSAHRTPDVAAKFAADARKNGFGVIIAAAGMAAHLAGVLAAKTTKIAKGYVLSCYLSFPLLSFHGTPAAQSQPWRRDGIYLS